MSAIVVLTAAGTAALVFTPAADAVLQWVVATVGTVDVHTVSLGGLVVASALVGAASEWWRHRRRSNRSRSWSTVELQVTTVADPGTVEFPTVPLGTVRQGRRHGLGNGHTRPLRVTR